MEFDSKYESYNLEELEDVLDHIDKEAYPDKTKKILEERDKRIMSKLDAVEEIPDNSDLIGITGAVYSPVQAGLGALLGGPIASIYFIKSNFDVIGSKKKSTKTVQIGCIVIFSLLVILQFLPDNFPNTVFTVLTLVGTMTLVEKLQFSNKDILISKGLNHQSNIKVFFTSLVCLSLLYILIFLFILILEMLIF